MKSKGDAEYLGLLFQCPMDHEMHDCALVHLRRVPLVERMKFFGNMSFQQKEEIIQKHRKCLFRRERRIPFSQIAIM